MVDLTGRVAMVTGAARGMGRTHAVALAEAGADVVLCDRCADLPTVAYPLADEQDLAETARLVAAAGRSALSMVFDVRDRTAVATAVADAVGRLGRLDILVANAGVSALTPIQGGDPAVWDDVLSTNLTGVYNCISAVAPILAEQRWGRIVATASMLGRSAAPAQAAYVASKWGVIGLVKSAAQDLASAGVTVNALAPGNVDTPMVRNDALFRLVRPDLEHPTADDAAVVLQSLHLQPIPWIDPAEVTEALMFLVGAAHITGSVIDINAGASARFSA
ncbi:mycofactocin-coupled SDR family oxidoreductase [Acidiferrimicrobium sp. IK]|uniref:mycofactocin-coupled SDR family oxidoreductase n=1 Tax=Acidiferrimicrobium sp. IK TaxID=2871700 RepID=UPI0021CB339D|nr:mycofactocin-coupled SDR family oxidoreductase [Acidiferrimicrobium sp. IK]MCU4182746.1 mycofactocin-coupled SDR family oxidoreductase [Acidiferrimicrobium sp. IK]